FEDLGIQMETANGETKSAISLLRVASVAMEDLSQQDQADAIRGLGGVWHYQRMQVLLETLRDANGMYDQMLDSSRNAEGSAAAENAIYMESLEARINKAKVAIEEFGLALGEAFLEAGILEFLTVYQLLRKLLLELVQILLLLLLLYLFLLLVIPCRWRSLLLLNLQRFVKSRAFGHTYRWHL